MQIRTGALGQASTYLQTRAATLTFRKVCRKSTFWGTLSFWGRTCKLTLASRLKKPCCKLSTSYAKKFWGPKESCLRSGPCFRTYLQSSDLTRWQQLTKKIKVTQICKTTNTSKTAFWRSATFRTPAWSATTNFNSSSIQSVRHFNPSRVTWYSVDQSTVSRLTRSIKFGNSSRCVSLY